MNTGTPIIPPQTGEVTDVASFPVVQKMLPATLMVSNIGAGESVAILVSLDGGDTFEPVFQDGVALVMDNTSNSLSIQAPVLLGVTKTATTLAVGVSILTTNAFSTGINTPINKYAAGGINPDMALVPRDNFYWTSAAQSTFAGITGGTFLRSTTATFTAAGGLLDTAAIDEARVNHHLFDGTSFVRAGMLVEEAATNLALRSEDFANATWQKLGVSVTSNVADGPGGANTMSRMTATNSGSGGVGLSQVNVTSFGVQTTVSFVVRTDGHRFVGFTGFGNGGAGVAFDLQTMTAQVNTAWDDAGIVNLGNNLALVWGVVTPALDGQVFFFMFNDIDGDRTHTIGDFVDIDMFQSEAANIPGGSSYIPTTGSTVARAADDLRIPAAVMAKAMADKAGAAELVTNGDFDTSATGWSPVNSTLSVVSGRLRVTNTAGFGSARQSFATVVGRTYLIGFEKFDGTAPSLFRIVDGASINLPTSPVLHTATTTLIEIQMYADNGSVGVYAEYDNISVREVTMPAAISIAVKGRMTYADEGLNPQSVLSNWEVDASNRIVQRLRTDGGNEGFMQFLQQDSGTLDAVGSAANAYSPGNNVPFSIASRHGATFINGAHEGTLLTADLTPTALADLVTADFEIATVGNFVIEEVLIWFDDIGDTGITEASQL